MASQPGMTLEIRLVDFNSKPSQKMWRNANIGKYFRSHPRFNPGDKRRCSWSVHGVVVIEQDTICKGKNVRYAVNQDQSSGVCVCVGLSEWVPTTYRKLQIRRGYPPYSLDGAFMIGTCHYARVVTLRVYLGPTRRFLKFQL